MFVPECLDINQITVKIIQQLLYVSFMKGAGNIVILLCQVLCWLMHSVKVCRLAY